MDISSSNADHVLLRLSDFADDPPIFITVRTRTREGTVSSDSNVARVPRGISVNTALGAVTQSAPIAVSNYATSMNDPGYGAFAVSRSLGTASSTNLLQPTQAAISTGQIATLSHPDYQLAGLPSSAPTANLLSGLSLGTTQEITDTKLKANITGTGTNLSRVQLGQVQQQQVAAQTQGINVLTGLPLNSAFQRNLYPTTQMNTAFTTSLTSNPMSVPTALNSYSAAAPLLSTNPSTDPALAFAPSTNIVFNHGGKSVPSTGALQETSSAEYLQGSWKPLNRYYTFHPKLLCREAAGTEEKPSVLEMEHNYLLKHRATQQLPTLPQNSRGKLEQYLRGRCISADDKQTKGFIGYLPRGYLPASLARLRSEELCSTRSEPDLRPIALDDNMCRWFVALYDYSHHMSPNVNAEEEELSFRKHQLIKVYGDVDPDGFYMGQIGHRIGLVPSNMVIEIAKDDVLSQRRRSDAVSDTATRRMRWGSFKSRSYDHAGDRIPPSYRQNIEPDYPTFHRREHSLPSRPLDYSLIRRPYDSRSDYGPRGDYGRIDYIPRNEHSRGDYVNRNEYEYSSRPEHSRGDYSARGEYSSRERDDIHKGYHGNERHQRDHHGRDSYPREYRKEPQERERHEYYRGERDGISSREMRNMREGRDQREGHELRDLRNLKDFRDVRDMRDISAEQRDYRDQRYSREATTSKRVKDYPEDGEDTRHRNYRDGRELRDIDYKEERGELARQYDERAGPSNRDPNVQREYRVRERGRPSEGGQTEPTRESQQNYATEPDEMRSSKINGDRRMIRKMRAIYDYDSTHLSPNIDGGQVELSFHAGDVITTYGEMDDDGFYWGELNGSQGLVPSNFLSPVAQSTMQPTKFPPEQSPQPVQPFTSVSASATANDQVHEQPRTKGVAFQEVVRKPMPRQSSQSSAKASANQKVTPKAGSGSKTLTKKPSDLGSKTGTATRKSSQASKKTDSSIKVHLDSSR
uniref:SH3 domain-containing protein n=1 Tax=Syphacia muris TaxID=451379 RepID=A0A0N5AZN5_9BILA